MAKSYLVDKHHIYVIMLLGGNDMTTIRVSEQVITILNRLKQAGQSYDGVLNELLLEALTSPTPTSLGTLGELVVIKELTMRGFHPAYTPTSSFDVVLASGARVEVKTSRAGLYEPSRIYKFNLVPKQRRRADFFICWGIDEDRFWIIPTAEVTKSGVVGIYSGASTKWSRFSEAWHLLDEFQRTPRHDTGA